MGYSIDEFRSDKVYIYGHAEDAERLSQQGFKAAAHVFKPEWFKWTPRDSELGKIEGISVKYHSYDEVKSALNDVVSRNPNIVSLMSLGKTVENRDVPMVRISGKTPGQAEGEKIPSIMYMGCHHAREHLSVEVPFMLIDYLVSNYGKDPNVTRLVDTREIFIAPMVNPDGHVFDFQGNSGRMWRKNRARNNGGTFGVDLNRNYGFHWGTGGSSTDPNSDVFMGPAAFSEPETQNIRNFVRSQKRMTSLLSFHTFSELVLYPWGHSYDKIGQNGLGKAEDLPVFEKMANTMAGWNGYRPQQASDLYIASGDTTDWAYGELGIFAFTFELTPTSLWSGGFYPEPTVIQPTFNSNLKPILYMMEYADNPHRVMTDKLPSYLQAAGESPASRGISAASLQDLRF
jgi:carboxypeptidase T